MSAVVLPEAPGTLADAIEPHIEVIQHAVAHWRSNGPLRLLPNPPTSLAPGTVFIALGDDDCGGYYCDDEIDSYSTEEEAHAAGMEQYGRDHCVVEVYLP